MKLFMCLVFGVGVAAFGQQTRVYNWIPSEEDVEARNRVYHPEPILFVHGINDDDRGWGEVVIPSLRGEFAVYDLPDEAQRNFIGNRLGFHARQEAYLHTFNYGDYVDRGPHHAQSFEHIEWNVLEEDKNNLIFPISWGNILTNAPGASDQRMTLDRRIEQIRSAYAQDSSDPNTWPNLVLVAHSMGGVLAHYYLIRRPTDHGVRRLVTLATPHLGSNYANWLLSYKNTGGSRMDTIRLFLMKQTFQEGFVPVRLGGQFLPQTKGFFQYTRHGAVEDISAIRTEGPAWLRHVNDLLQTFWNTPAPKIEYVFNVFRKISVDKYIVARVAATERELSGVLIYGDGVVSQASAAGKMDKDSPSIWNGDQNENGSHDIDPVIFGTWYSRNHSDAAQDTNAVIQSLCGVAYRWIPAAMDEPLRPPLYFGSIPAYARTYNENQSFSKYLPLMDNDICYTDEPGVADLKLLYVRESGNPLLIPTRDTWGVANEVPAKIHTNRADLGGCQIIRGSQANPVAVVATYGAKNRSETPIAFVNGSHYRVGDGNEYLPASLRAKIETDSRPIRDSGNGDFSYNTGQGCLTQLDADGNPRYQYALCWPWSTFSVVASQNFVAVQARNAAGLVTPQAERAFDVVTDSSTVVTILREINRLQELLCRTNHCSGVPSVSPSHWTTRVTEVVSLQGNTVTQNFHSATSGSDTVVRDFFNPHWVVESEQYAYQEEDCSLQFTDTDHLPTHMTVTYTALVGDRSAFQIGGGDTNSPVTVSPLETEGLAGVPMTPELLGQMRAAVEELIPHFLNTRTNASCVFWTKPDILRAAGFPGTDWTPLAEGGRVEAAHVEQVQDVVGLLLSTPATNQFSVKLFNAVPITISPGNSNNIIATALANVPQGCGARYFLAGDPNGTLGICADNGIEVNGTLLEVSGGYPYELGKPIEECAPRSGPIEVTGLIREGEENQFRAVDWGVVLGLTDIYLVRCPR